MATLSKRSPHPEPIIERVRGSQIRPIGVVVERRSDPSTAATFVPGGRYRPEKFPALEQVMQVMKDQAVNNGSGSFD